MDQSKASIQIFKYLNIQILNIQPFKCSNSLIITWKTPLITLYQSCRHPDKHFIRH